MNWDELERRHQARRRDFQRVCIIGMTVGILLIVLSYVLSVYWGFKP